MRKERHDDADRERDGPIEDRLDRATANRLGKLRTLPVDTSRLEKRLRSEIPGIDLRNRRAGSTVIGPMRIGWLRPIRAVAAVLLVGAVLAAILLATSGGPALASAAQMAQVHEDLVSGRTPVLQVDSIEEAGKALSQQWPQSPGLPALPREHVMACCMKSVKDKKVACVLLKNEGVPITMAVANAADMRLPESPTVARGGVTYHVQSTGRLNMVMTEREGRWVCLIGELPAERLMDFASQLRF